MTKLNVEQTDSLDSVCDMLLSIKGIRFIGIINKNGKKIAGRFRKGVRPLVQNKDMQMHYMQLCLDLTMRREFTKSLGDIKHIVAEREKVNIVSLPIGKNFVMVSLDKKLNVKKIIEKIYKTFQYLPDVNLQKT